MNRLLITLATLLTAGGLQAQESIPEYVDPLDGIVIQDGEGYQFERSSLRALNVQDPIEGFNRRIYRFNARFDELVYLPVLNTYEWATPSFVRTGVSNVFNNLGDIPNLGNSILQGKVRKSMRTTARLLFNTTLGVAGLFDVAKKMGLPQQREDFGQTLGFYRVPPGPYLVLPFLGPSSLRDTTGQVVDWTFEDSVEFLNNREIKNNNPSLWALQAVDLRYQNEFRYGALGSPLEYDQVRYLYTKLRELQISQ